ncbi:MAG: hypothetical protein AAF502_21610 [Bacteroidota bacterium]
MIDEAAIKKFWNWFLEKEHLFYFGTENQDELETLFDLVSEQLKTFNETIVCEFSPIREDKIKEFCISADGMKEAFDDVKSIVSLAPKHEHWEFTAFRQRIPGDSLGINMGDIKIGYEDLFFRFADQGDKFGIELNIRDYQESGREQNAIFILMDALIGEYDVVMEIDWIDWVKLEESNKENLLPFVELRSIIDRRKTSTR